ncbi:MAG: SH3 domain-containing protein [Alphaproteobacteria bacterium]|nr:SH3 domain-containing protein [Alphaproteobacteria bacterium]
MRGKEILYAFPFERALYSVMPRLPTALIAALALYLTAPVAAAQAVRTDTPSGLPVPRFVNLKSDKTNCRLGPSFDYPVVVTYMRAGLPVEVIAETKSHWRKIRDHDGTECWAHEATLRAPSRALVVRETPILARPEKGAPVRARLAAGVLVKPLGASGEWRQVTADGLRGWLPRAALWGAE